jgi:hypothetical protein
LYRCFERDLAYVLARLKSVKKNADDINTALKKAARGTVALFSVRKRGASLQRGAS